MARETEGRQTPPNRPPVTPSPGALGIAFLLVLLLFLNVYLDAGSASYDGKYLTFADTALIAGILGVDASRLWRRGQGGDDK